MQKSKKKLLGLLGLAFVAAMTVFAYLLPADGAFAEGASDSHTDTIRVTVYDRFPAIKIDSPATDYVSTSPELDVAFTYENSQYVDFTISYYELDDDGNIKLDDEGNPIVVTVALPRFNPSEERLDPVFRFDSDSQTVTINLDTPNPETGASAIGYGHYILTVSADSPIGKPADDFIEFDYVPAALEQTGTAEKTNDPIIEVDYDEGVAKIEVMPVDKNGNPLFDEPIVIEIPAPYESGSETIVLPFTSYGIPSGDYDVIITAYSATVTPGEIDPETGEQGEDVVSYEVIETPRSAYPVNYVQPPAPDVPNTGRFLGELNLASSDIVITSVIAFAGCAMVAWILIGRKKKDYRKNIRGRR